MYLGVHMANAPQCSRVHRSAVQCSASQIHMGVKHDESALLERRVRFPVGTPKHCLWGMGKGEFMIMMIHASAQARGWRVEGGEWSREQHSTTQHRARALGWDEEWELDWIGCMEMQGVISVVLCVAVVHSSGSRAEQSRAVNKGVGEEREKRRVAWNDLPMEFLRLISPASGMRPGWRRSGDLIRGANS